MSVEKISEQRLKCCSLCVQVCKNGCGCVHTGVCLCLGVCQRANIRWGGLFAGTWEPGEKSPATEPFFRWDGLVAERGLLQDWSWN